MSNETSRGAGGRKEEVGVLEDLSVMVLKRGDALEELEREGRLNRGGLFPGDDMWTLLLTVLFTILSTKLTMILSFCFSF